MLPKPISDSPQGTSFLANDPEWLSAKKITHLSNLLVKSEDSVQILTLCLAEMTKAHIAVVAGLGR